MTDLEDSDGWKDCAQEPDTTTFYRIVSAFTNHVRNSPSPVSALDEIIDQYRPRRRKVGDWRVEVHDVFIDSWVRYSPEIQSALPEPMRPSDRKMLSYRDAVEYVLTFGDWPEDCAKPYIIL